MLLISEDITFTSVFGDYVIRSINSYNILDISMKDEHEKIGRFEIFLKIGGEQEINLYTSYLYNWIICIIRISAAYQVGLRSKVSNEAGKNVRVLCGVFEGLV